MTAMDIINRVDSMEPNAYGPEQKLVWLSILDGKTYEEIIKPREENAEGFKEYVNGSEKLLIPFPYGYDIYYHYLMAMCAIEDGETQRANRRMTLFNNAYTEYVNWYCRNHNMSAVRPGETPRRFKF